MRYQLSKTEVWPQRETLGVKAGDKVRYKQSFIMRHHPNAAIAEALAALRGTIMEIHNGFAHINFGCHHRASSVVPLDKLEKIP